MRKILVSLLAIALFMVATATCFAANPPIHYTVTNQSTMFTSELVLYLANNSTGKKINGMPGTSIELAPGQSVTYGNQAYVLTNPSATLDPTIDYISTTGAPILLRVYMRVLLNVASDGTETWGPLMDKAPWPIGQVGATLTWGGTGCPTNINAPVVTEFDMLPDSNEVSIDGLVE